MASRVDPTQVLPVDLLAVATVKPIDEAALAASAVKTRAVLAVEEHSIAGGFGGAVAEALARHAPAKMDFIGMEDRFTESGPYDALLKKYGISVEAIVAKGRRLAAEKRAAAAVAVLKAVAAEKAAAPGPAAKAAPAKPKAGMVAARKPAAKRVARTAVAKAGVKHATPKKVVAKKPATGQVAPRRPPGKKGVRRR